MRRSIIRKMGIMAIFRKIRLYGDGVDAAIASEQTPAGSGGLSKYTFNAAL